MRKNSIFSSFFAQQDQEEQLQHVTGDEERKHSMVFVRKDRGGRWMVPNHSPSTRRRRGMILVLS